MALLAFAAGVAVGAFTVGGRAAARPAAPADPLSDESVGATAGQGAADAPSDSDRASAPTGRPSSPLPAANPSVPTLAAPLSDPERRRRHLVAEAARKDLGDDLPEDYLAEAVRQAQASEEGAAAASGRQFAALEKARRTLGELTDPWEIVVRVRTGSSLNFGVSDLLERPRIRLATESLDVTHAVVVAPKPEPNTAWMKGGIAPFGMTAVLEAIEVDGEFGAKGADDGVVEIRFDSTDIAKCRGRGTTRARLAGSHQGWWWSGTRPSDVEINATLVAAEVRLKGRLVPIPRDLSQRLPVRAFRTVEYESDGLCRGGPVVLQVVGDGTLVFEGSRDRVAGVSRLPLWDEAVDLAKPRNGAFYASGAGWIPPGKAFRVRRVEWRARMASWEDSEFQVRVAGSEVAHLPDKGETGEDRRAHEKERERRRREAYERQRRGETVPLQTVSGTWTGEALVRAERERETLIECRFTMGEAVFYGDLVDDDRK